jgi:hypothetical protein
MERVEQVRVEQLVHREIRGHQEPQVLKVPKVKSVRRVRKGFKGRLAQKVRKVMQGPPGIFL